MKISELLDEDTISELVTSIFRIRLDSGRSVGAVLTLNYPAGHVRALLTNAINETEVYGEVSTSVSTGSDQPDPLLAALGGNRQTYHFLTGKYPEEDVEDVAAMARRWQWLCINRPTLLITGIFGNGCTNKTIDDVEIIIDRADDRGLLPVRFPPTEDCHVGPNCICQHKDQ